MQPNDSRVVSNFNVNTLQGKDITIDGNREQSSVFAGLMTSFDTMVRMMNSEASFTGQINTGNPGGFTMLQLTEKVLCLSNNKSKFVFAPLPSDDPTQRKPDIGRAREMLGGWDPKVQLEAGLQQTIDYFNERLMP
jgi:UDP-glucuronate decarboxylase